MPVMRIAPVVHVVDLEIEMLRHFEGPVEADLISPILAVVVATAAVVPFAVAPLAAPGPALDELEPAGVLGDLEHDLLAGARHLGGVPRHEGLFQGELDAVAARGLDVDRAADVVDHQRPLAGDGGKR